MAAATEGGMSRRERQIMDVIYRLREASVADVRAEMADAPSYSTVRALLNVLAKKGHVKRSSEGPRHVYRPTKSRDEARVSALERVLTTFFDGSPTKAMATLIELSAADMSEHDLKDLENLIKDARREGK